MTTSVVMSDDLCPRDLVGVCDCRLVGWTWGEGWAGVMVTPLIRTPCAGSGLRGMEQHRTRSRSLFSSRSCCVPGTILSVTPAVDSLLYLIQHGSTNHEWLPA